MKSTDGVKRKGVGRREKEANQNKIRSLRNSQPMHVQESRNAPISAERLLIPLSLASAERASARTRATTASAAML